MTETLRGSIRESVERIGTPSIARSMGWKQSELVRSLAPREKKSGALKLDCDDFVRLLEITGDASPIVWLVRYFETVKARR